jgi:hypothetical protein
LEVATDGFEILSAAGLSWTIAPDAFSISRPLERFLPPNIARKQKFGFVLARRFELTNFRY